MADGESINRDREPPWDGVRRWYWRLRRRLSLRPTGLTPADVVPPGARPICPRCVLPHHPAAARCPNCWEIISRYATLMPFVWIWVWGPRLQRVVRQERLSRLLWAGLLVSSVSYLAGSLGWWLLQPLSRTYAGTGPVWVLQGPILSVSLVGTAVYLGAAFQMLKAVVQKWGTWREDAAEEPSGD